MSAQVRPGYKLTEVGVIPEDWESTPLASFATSIASGRSKPDAIYGKYPVYGSTGAIGYTNNASHIGPAILIARVGANAGKLNVVDGHYGVTDNTIVVRLSENLCLPFFYLQLERKRLNNLVFGSGQPLITGTQLKKLSLLAPPLHEQRIIASALSDMDALISSLDRLIAKKRDIKQAAMQLLLTGQKRLPGYSGEWDVKSLESVSAFITKGSTPTTYGFEWQASGVLFLRSECISESGLDLSQSMFISGKAHEVLRRSEVCTGDLLITITGNVGRVVYLDGDDFSANINQHIARVRITSPDVDAGYVYQFLSLPDQRKYYNSITTGQAYPQLSLKQIRETQVRMPTKSEQTAIATILSDMDTELAALEQRRDKAKLLKQGMMQELLTGRIRLV